MDDRIDPMRRGVCRALSVMPFAALAASDAMFARGRV
jgi:hypothetical protein